MHSAQRLRSLDAFRGLTILLMILVNTPGDGRYVYPPLRHAAWHGWTITDCVFPSFVWIIGVAITLSLGRRREAPLSQHGKILRRAAVLFALGVSIYAFPEFDLATFRILGVLQRLAICYAAASLLFLHTGVRGQVTTAIGLLAVYWILLRFVPAPGFAAGDFSMEGNVAHALDRAILGLHNYRHTKTWDPEGILSTLPAIASCLAGVLVGHLLRREETVSGKAARIALFGVALAGLGLLLEPWMPVNKQLWTPTFVLLMAGIDSIVFAGMYWLIDGPGRVRIFQVPIVVGQNAIALYLSSEFLEIGLDHWGWKRRIFESAFLPYAAPVNASLAYACAYVALHICIAYGMRARGWYPRV